MKEIDRTLAGSDGRRWSHRPVLRSPVTAVSVVVRPDSELGHDRQVITDRPEEGAGVRCHGSHIKYGGGSDALVR